MNKIYGGKYIVDATMLTLTTTIALRDKARDEFFEYEERKRNAGVSHSEYSKDPKYIDLRNKYTALEREVELVRKQLIEKGIIKRTATDAGLDARKRFNNLGKLKKTVAKVTGQYRKFKKLERRAKSFDGMNDERLKSELDGMFKSR